MKTQAAWNSLFKIRELLAVPNTTNGTTKIVRTRLKQTPITCRAAKFWARLKDALTATDASLSSARCKTLCKSIKDLARERARHHACHHTNTCSQGCQWHRSPIEKNKHVVPKMIIAGVAALATQHEADSCAAKRRCCHKGATTLSPEESANVATGVVAIWRLLQEIQSWSD